MKGNDAEAVMDLIHFCWAYGEEPYDCHHEFDGELPKEYLLLSEHVVYLHVTLQLFFSVDSGSTFFT